jgi:endonuclease/exonuclease/phosphatase (EEP) superfamily protein YafD
LNNLEFQQKNHRDNHDNVMIVWDFNISPWSIFYKKFQDWLGSGFIDITKKSPGLFSWYLFNLPILWSHIDHIWINFDVKNIYLNSVKIDWSDHRGYLIKMK